MDLSEEMLKLETSWKPSLRSIATAEATAINSGLRLAQVYA